MNSIHPKVIRQIFVLILIVLMGTLIFREMLPYLSGVLGAITLFFILRNFMGTLIKKGWNPDWAAVLLLFLSFFCILVPVAGIALMLGNKVGTITNKPEEFVKKTEGLLSKWESQIGFEFTSNIDTSEISSWLSNNLFSFAGGTFNIVLSLGIMYLLLFYMLTNRRMLRQSLFEYIPINNDNLKIISTECEKMVKSNALGIPLVAIVQGVVALIGFFIFQIEDPFFWFTIVAVGSIIPFVGTLIGILPVFLLTLSTGTPFQAWGILLYGIIVVGSSDNIVRLYVLRRLDDVHPLITLIGVIVGVPLFGFIGLIFGPLMISLFLVVLRIYKIEYGQTKEDKTHL
ncbi:transmembrane protein [Sediminicola sp. YIK13]|uniref:AI-2E family transporter n=1 Tax=Sediminicola sp. YIK13 TaxID=1453352 RepID=UPI00072028A0|nr:AI-2E family transporter [Sediminicola sp. YIK13]ALM06918.1 transmembrane protein [Sediminicola sp. YIK13]